MAFAQTIGARAIILWKQVQAWAGGAVKPFAAEEAGDTTGASLASVASALDTHTAKQTSSAHTQEYAAAYALARDFRYSRRSRRWLFARSLQTKYDQAYDQWSGFMLENRKKPNVAPMLNQNALQLASTDFSKTLAQT